MIKKEELDKLGSANLLEWMKECVDIIEEDFRLDYKPETSIEHIYPTNLKDFQKQLEQYANRHPNAKIRASGFFMCIE